MDKSAALKEHNNSENLVSQSGFARLCHVARQTISMAVRSGAVFTSGISRKIDLAHEVNASYLTKCEYRYSLKTAENEEIEKREAEGIFVNPPPEVNHKKQPATAPDFKALPEDSPKADLIEVLATRKIRAGVEKAELELARARGELVNRNDVALVFGKIHSVDTQEFHTLAQRVAPLIGAACGIEDPKDLIKITNILDAEVFKSLNHIKSHIDTFLAEHEER